jgi:hypothetical protein
MITVNSPDDFSNNSVLVSTPSTSVGSQGKSSTPTNRDCKPLKFSWFPAFGVIAVVIIRTPYFPVYNFSKAVKASSVRGLMLEAATA